MKDLQKVGGYAAIAQGLGFVALLIILFTVFVPKGLTPPVDPAKEIAAAAGSPAPFLIINLIVVLFSITIILVTLALNDRLQAGAPTRMRLAVIAATIGGALFLANGIISFTGYPPLVLTLSLTDNAAAIATVRALDAVVEGLLSAAIFAYGASALLWGWGALSTKGLPMPLSYFVLLAGGVAVLSFVVPPFGLIGPVINVVWSLWLGWVLLRQPSPMAAAMTQA